MLIVCPSCAASYDVPDDRLVPGRAVRCSSCEASWTPRPLLAGPVTVPAPMVVVPVPVPALVPVPPPSTPQVSRVILPGKGRPRDATAVMLGWVLTGLIVGGALWSGIARRDSIMQAWPPSERLYSVLGLYRP